MRTTLRHPHCAIGALILAPLFLLMPHLVRANSVILTQESQRTMTARLDDGRVVINDMATYAVDGVWYVPSGELFHSLGLAVEVVPEDGLVRGEFLSHERKFRLSSKECRLTNFLGKNEEFACRMAVIHEDDVYLAASLIERLLPLQLRLNSFRSEVIIDSAEELEPVALGESRTRQGRLDPGYPRIDPGVERFDGVFMDQQLTYVSETGPNSRLEGLRHDTVFSGELLGMETSYFINGHEDKITRQRLTLAKHNADGNQLGPHLGSFGVQEIQLVDVTFPSVPMIGGGGLFRGGLISSFPASTGSSSQYGTHDFTGDLPAGWEVELFQNDVFIDRHTSVAGRYEFLNVPLNFGVNRFRLAFYGPQGQRREGHETHSLESSFLKPGEHAFRVAFADDLGANARFLLQYDRSVGKTFNLFSATSRYSSNLATAEPVIYGLLGGRTLVREFLISVAGASSERGGVAAATDAQVPLKTATLGVGYTRLSSFSSDYFKPDPIHLDPQDIYRANMTFDVFSLHTVRVGLEASQTVFRDGYARDILTNRISTVTGPIKWFNTINVDRSATIATAGELASQTSIQQTDTRVSLGYDERRVNSATIDLRKSISDLTKVSVGWIETFQQSLRKHLVSVTQQFATFTLTANASLDNKGAWGVGALLSYSLEREPRNNSWTVLPRPQALLGSISIYAFHDQNQNGLQDAEEPPVEGAEVVLNQQDTGVKTGKNGIAVLRGLPAQEPADVTLSLASFESDRMTVFPKGARVYPRAGKMSKVDFMIEATGEIGGLIRYRSRGGESAKRGIRVRLERQDYDDVRDVTSDADGYYLFTDLTPGIYRISLDSLQLNGLKLKTQDRTRLLVIKPGDAPQHHQDFILDLVLPEPKDRRKGF
jgi:hypothetical protein